jgi:dipeptidyl-peptidase-4
MHPLLNRRLIVGILFLHLLIALDLSAAAGVYRDRIEPHWLANNTSFWYRNSGPAGTVEFIRVDAETGKREPAFDHARFAGLLQTILSRPVTANHLPIDTLDFDADPGAILLSGQGKTWKLDPERYTLTVTKAHATTASSLPPISKVHPSRSGGEASAITFLNQLANPVNIIWIDPSGEKHPYATLKPGEQWQQSSFVGHVWLVTAGAGATVGVFEVTSPSATAIIGGPAASKPSSVPNPRRNAGRRSGARGAASPDGAWVITLSDHNLSLRNKSSGEMFPLSDDGKLDDAYALDQLWWSPDSRHLLAVRTEPAQEHKIYTVESSPKDQLQPKLRTLDYLKPGDRIARQHPALFDIASHRQIPMKQDLFPNPWSLTDFRWAADSSRFTFVYNQRGHQVLRVVAVDAMNGAARTLVDEHASTFIDYSGKYFCEWIGDDELIWMSERDGWNHLWRYDARAGKVKNVITPGEFPIQAVLRVDAANREVWFRAGGVRAGQDPYYSHFCRAKLDGSTMTVLTEGNGTHTVQWSPDQRFFIDSYSRVDMPPVHELRRSDTGNRVCDLEEADGSELLASHGGRWPERFVAKGRDGTTDIHGVIIYPKEFDPNKKYPVVENIYAGPQDFFAPKAFRARYGHQQQIADRGTIVVQCDGMGTSGRSKAFHDVCWKNLRDAGFPDRIAWIKAAAAAHAQMDLGRVGIYGGSAGGQNAMAAVLWHNDFYKVAVADCGCHDNRMDKIWWNEQWMGYPIGPEYAENSNAVNARLLQGKLLLIFGELDDNVDPSSTMQVVNALEKADKEFDLVIVTGAHHGAAETPYGSKRRLEFLANHLLGGDSSH